MSVPMKCEKCGAVSGFAPRFPCVHPPCDGERYLDKDALRTQVLSESPAPVPPVAEARESLLDRLEALVRAEKTAGGPSAANSPLLAAHDFRCSLDALCAAVRAEERKQLAAEARTRLCAIDPVGLRTGPLYDWLTQEMGQ